MAGPIRELRTKFEGTAKGFKATINEVKKEIRQLGPTTDKAVQEANKSYDDLLKSTGKLEKALEKSGNPKVFKPLATAIEDAKREMDVYGEVSEGTQRRLQKAVQKSEQELKKLGTEGSDSFEELESAINLVNQDLQKLGLKTGLDQTDKAAQKTTDNLKELGASGKKSMDDIEKASDKADDALADVGKDSKGLEDFNSEVDKTESNVGNLGDSVSETNNKLKETGDSKKGIAGVAEAFIGIKGSTLAAAAGVTAFLAGIYKAVAVADEMQGTMNKLSVQTGATDEELKEMNSSIRDIYSANVGPGIREIGDAMAYVKQATKLTGDELESATKEALLLQDAFGWEVPETINAARQMMNEFGYSSEEALTLLAQGQQTGVNVGNDLLDTFWEYSHAFADLGFNGEQSMNMLNNAIEAGARNSDVAADAVNEFATRIRDGSDTTREALQAAGLNADEIIEKFNKGGESGREAFKQVTDAIGGIGDASKQEQAAVGLFGTLAEDVGVRAVLALGDVEGQADKTADTLKEINDVNYDTIGEAAQGVGRKFVTGVLLPIQDKVMPGINTAIDKVTEWSGKLRKVFGSLFSDHKAEGASLLKQMGFDDKEIQLAIRSANLIMDAINRIRTIISSLFSDNKAEGAYLLKQMGLSDEQVQMAIRIANGIMGAVERIPDAFKLVLGLAKTLVSNAIAVFRTIYPFIEPILNDVVTFVGNIVGQIVSFWKSDGQQIIQAVKNAFNFVLSIIKFVMPVVLAIIESVWGSIKNVIQGAVNVIKGIIQVFTGIFTGDFKKMWEGIKNIFFGAIELVWGYINLLLVGRILKGVKLLFNGFKAAATAGWAAIKNLFGGNLGAIVGNLRTAWTTAWNATRTAFTGIWNFLKDTFNTLKSLFTGTFNIFRTVISNSWKFIWNNTKTVFNGIWTFLKGIFNFLKTTFNAAFNGYFRLVTGIWSRIFNTTKTVFQGVWNFLKGIFNTIKNLFTTVFNAYYRLVTSIWTKIWNTTKSVFNNVWNFLKSIFNFLKSTFTTAFNAYYRLVTTVWNRIWNTTKSVFQNVWNFLKGIFNTIRDFISGRVSSIYNRVKGAWDNIYSRTKSIFKNVYNTVRDWFGKIVDRAKELPGKIGDGIGKMKDKVTGGIKKVINSMTDILGKGVNGVIGGVNWVLEKLNVPEDKWVDTWDVPKYAKGTKGHPGGAAIVGDGRGSNAGQELIQTPDGKVALSPDTDTLMNLPKGSTVVSAKDTRKLLDEIPAYANGISGKISGAISGIAKKGKGLYEVGKEKLSSFKDTASSTASAVKEGVKKGAKKIKDVAFNIWDYATNPGKLLKLAMKTLGFEIPTLPKPFGEAGKKAFSLATKGAHDFIRKKFDDFGSFDSSAPGNVKSWISAAIYRTGVPSSWLGPLTTIAMKESGGNPNAINKWDINWKNGIPSQGLMQTIPPTFHANKEPGWDNILNPIHNAAAAINYIKRRYGSINEVPGIKAMLNGMKYVGYADGGIVDTAQLAWIAEGGWAESIISHDPAKRPSQRAIWEQTGRELGFFQDDQDNQEILDLLLRIANATERERAILLNDEKLAEFVKDTIDQANGENYAVSKFKL
ncbi:hypothetical protein CHH91_04630 [Virgibacillus sp. 7505]|uniref:phage tail tape measure protein n=1 Tax=Virgibacillus sp. 7505 TaxID=2022548 RepID=UPI000BA562F6|nr:phage tail tape measure protein [Virgibacillus sp. 7505]PAE17295.1 hypothetical protein CHH91_04630 [Virgibacillus sp. 7505]